MPTMTKSTLLRALGVSVPMFAWTVALHAQAAPAPAATAATPPEETVTLPTFSVSDVKADPYKSDDVLSVARIAGSVLDAPFTVNVVSPELVSDFSANVGYDVNRYFAGVSNGRGSSAGGINDRQNFRGFESFSKTVDDFSLFIIPTANGPQANFDTVFQDRAELVMGPDSILSPTGTPGGSINIITKSPEYTRSTTLTAEYGNYDANRYTLDTTGPITNKLAYRIMADYQDGKEYVPGAIRQQNLGLELSYKFSDVTKLTLKYFGESWGVVGAQTNVNDNEEQIYLPNTVMGATISGDFEPGYTPRGWDGSAVWSHRRDPINIAEAEFTTQLWNKVSMRVGLQGMTDHFTQDAAYPSINPAETFNQTTGQEIAVATEDPTNIPVVGQYEHYYWRGEQFQNDYAANFHPGPVSIQPVAGVAYSQGHMFYNVNTQDKSAVDLPNENLYLNYYAPTPPSKLDYTSGFGNTPETGVLTQLYAVTRVGILDDRIFMTGGATRTWANINDYTSHTFIANAAGPLPTGPYSDVQLSSLHDSYLGGILGKVTDSLSVYGTFSSNASITASSANAPLWETGKQYEFGAKAEFFHKRLQISADHFQITEFNLSTPNPAHNTDASQPTFLLGNATSKGEELNVVGGITKNLSVIASVTNQKYRDLFGRRVRNVPDQLANLLLNYHFSDGVVKGANVFAGVVHTGQVAGETVSASTTLGVPEQPGFYIRPWTIVNAGAGYGWDNIKVNVNVDNALNSKFLWAPASRQSVSEYPGLTARLTLTIKL
jgi:outer membrane receptor for ferric coprogen and ferric-rhodotorulic acid